VSSDLIRSLDWGTRQFAGEVTWRITPETRPRGDPVVDHLKGRSNIPVPVSTLTTVANKKKPGAIFCYFEADRDLTFK